MRCLAAETMVGREDGVTAWRLEPARLVEILRAHGRLDGRTYPHSGKGHVMKDEGKVLTVLGPIEPERLGVTVTHEHILFDWGLTYWTEPQTDEERVLADAPIRLDNRGILQEEPFSDQGELLAGVRPRCDP